MSSNHHQQQVVGVLGGTGRQGGSVIEELLKAGNYKIRALTRNTNSDATKKLDQQGVELYEGNLNDEQSIKRFMQGLYAVFAVTNFWDPETFKGWKQLSELKQGKALSDAADEAGVKVFIWSTLPDGEKISGGKYTVPHLTQKAKVDEYIRSKQHPFKYVAVLPSTYYDNFTGALKPADQSNLFVFNLPAKGTGIWSIFDVADTGRVVRAVLDDVDKYVNKTVLMVAERLTLNDLVKQYGEALGKEAVLNELTDEQFTGFFPSHLREVAEELVEMFRFFDDYGLGDGKGLIPNEVEGKDVAPLTPWKEWVKTNAQ